MFRELESRLRSIHTRCPGFSDAQLFSGTVSLGSIDRDPVEMLKSASSVCQELTDASCEVILNVREIERNIDRFGDVASERKVIIEVITGVVIRTPRVSSASAHMSFVGDLSLLRESQIENLIKSCYERAKAMAKSKPLNPLAAGKADVILKPDLAAALFHEVSHLLEGDAINHLRIGTQIGPPELDIIDDPRYVSAASIRLFDDEGVVTHRRTLVESGVVVDLHHTRSTAHILGSTPGSAHGLFHIPRPFHTVLIVKPGDWKDDEIVEETKRGFIAEGLMEASTQGTYIRIVPESVWYVEGGELKEPVRISAIKIPLTKIKTISAMSRSLGTRIAYEKGHLVSEIAPTIRLQAYIE